MSVSSEEEKFGMGIATFMGGDYVRDIAATADYDVAFLGVPVEGGASYRHGQSLAPNILRRYSAWDRLDGAEFIDLDRDGQYLVSKDQRIVDLGDIVINESDPAGTIEKIKQKAGAIAANCFPVFIGGDHSITYSTFQGARSRVDKDAKIGLLHFDAHYDLESHYQNLPTIWHGNVFRQLIEEGHIKGNDLFTVGVRGIVPKSWVDYAQEKGVNYATANDVHRDKQGVIEKVRQALADYDAIYITLDVDVLDPPYCPGTGTPRANGLTPNDVVDIVRSLERPLLALDIVEFSPQYDQNGQSAVNICEMLYDFLAFRRER